MEADMDWKDRPAMISDLVIDLIVGFIDFMIGFNLRTRNFSQGGR
jgi:hypothetical protein